MRLLSCLLLLSTALSAQTKIDSIRDAEGDLLRVLHLHYDSTVIMSKSELFMRGIALDDPRAKQGHWVVDSVEVFKEGRAIGVTRPSINLRSSGSTVTKIEGRIGLRTVLPVPLPLRPRPKFDDARQQATLQPKIEGEAVTVIMPIKEGTGKLRLDSTGFYTFTWLGYHLHEEDFVNRGAALTLPPHVLEKGRILYLRRSGNEHLISVYQEDKLLLRRPAGQIRTPVNLKGWASGTYLLELSVPATGKKKYLRLTLP